LTKIDLVIAYPLNVFQNVRMSNNAHISSSSSSDLLSGLAACMGKVGDRSFNQAFLNLVETHLGADQVMVFSYGANKPTCYLSYNTHPEKNANQLAQAYLETGYADDPLQPQISRLADINGTDVFSLSTLATNMAPLYRHRFFEQPGIVDKLTVLARRDTSCLGVNFYRFADSGAFAPELTANPVLDVLGQLALLHYSDSQPQDMRSPLLSLSEREREICEGILRGKTTDAIAWELEVAPSTVTTYRKRAYLKLGINSKPALFTLCGADR